jgi:CDGSH-type Zn-finger protein
LLKKQQFAQVLSCQCGSSKKKLTCLGKIRLIPPVAQIAQSVEQRIENPRVGGSIPPLGTIKNKKASPM